MYHQSIPKLAILAVLLTVALSAPTGVRAQTANADYHSMPPFLSDVVTPNVLFLMDNSGSMTNRACEATSCGKLPDGSTSTTTTFTATTKYSGYFDPLTCYTYDAPNTRFEASTTKASLSTACATSLWDGNFLNWATFRRFDAVKKAMTGGDCSVARAADGTCPASGSPALKSINAITKFDSSSSGHETASVTSSGADGYPGRVPSTVTPGDPLTLRVHLRGGTSGMQGSFCLDDDGSPPASNATSCTDADGFAESQFVLRVVVSSEPMGVVQQIGTKARFGLIVFKGVGDGGRMLTGIGSRQSINFAGSTVETFTTNTGAMIDSVDESFPTTWTPLAESLYDATRYLAQINSSYTPSVYTYPIAFSGGDSNGVAFQATGTGSVGASEISALSGGETCPAGYIASACGRDPYFFGSNHTPAWASTPKVVTCCRTFIIVFTDGEPTQDLNIPSSIQDYAHAAHGVHCTGSDASSPTAPIDSTCNTHPATSPTTLLGEHKTSYADNGSHYLDDVAYWAHTVDLRNPSITGLPGVTGKDLPGMQNVTVYTFFAFGNINGREILMSAAKQGAFEDGNGNNLPDLASEYDKEDNYTGAASPDGLPDSYFESANVDDLEDRLLSTITSILRKVSSGTSVSVLAASATGEGAIYQSYFFPSTFETSTLTDVKWTGYTQGLFLDAFGNQREDTNQDGRLVLKQDKIIVNRYDSAAQLVKVDKYVDLNEDGKADDRNGDSVVNTSDCSPCDVLLKDILPIWEAGKQLALKDQGARNLVTWVDANNDGVVDTGEQVAFTTDNATTLAPYLRADPGLYSAANIINFIRGIDPQVTGMRDRRLQLPPESGTLKVWKLGDSLHATPVVVGAPMERYDVLYGDSSYTAFFAHYKNRRQVAYVGANDGMLHAFNVGFYHRGDDLSTSSAVEHGWFTRTATDNSGGPLLGDELWGFIPYQLLPQLKWLAQPEYLHVYYVDLKPKVTDVRIFTPDADHPNGWGTILIGGMRLGGSCGATNPGCQPSTGAPPMTVTADFGSGIQTRTFYSAYFVLDVTNPEVAPKLLMSFTDVSLGLTTSYPAVVRVNPSGDPKTSNTNAKWIMAVGSGPTSYDARSAQIGKIFSIDLASGPGTGNVNVATFSASGTNSMMGDLISVDMDLDYRVDVLYSGNTIDDGSSPWTGKLYRLTTGTVAPFGGATTPSSWGYTQAPTVLLGSVTGGPTVGPIMAAPTVATDEAGKLWVFWGTGRFLSAADKTDADTRHFFGVKDAVLTGACTQSGVANCEQGSLVDVSAATVCVVGTGNCGQEGGTSQVTGVTGVSGTLNFSGSSTSTLEGLVHSMDGWFTTLPDLRERSVVSPTLLGGIVYFPTFVPLDDLCVASGSSFLYALFYKTGSAYKESVIGTSPSGSNSVVNRRIALSGVGLSSQMAVHIGAQGSGNFGAGDGSGTGVGSGCEGHVTGFIQSSTGNLSQVCSKPPIEVWSHLISWINLRL